ncbi:MAG TPA: hypothetical protein VNE00_21325 [Paraburkholderia sp.]|nr:hypothetical protein [Paraburkholderia sp.]
MEARPNRVEITPENVAQNYESLRVDIRDLRKSQRADFHITWVAMVAMSMLVAKGFHWF